jgi:hypothetical protein
MPVLGGHLKDPALMKNTHVRTKWKMLIPFLLFGYPVFAQSTFPTTFTVTSPASQASCRVYSVLGVTVETTCSDSTNQEMSTISGGVSILDFDDILCLMYVNNTAAPYPANGSGGGVLGVTAPGTANYQCSVAGNVTTGTISLVTTPSSSPAVKGLLVHTPAGASENEGAWIPASTKAMNTTGATLLVAAVGDYGPGQLNFQGDQITSSYGNTWHCLPQVSYSSTTASLCYAYDHNGSALVTGPAETVTISGNCCSGVVFAAFSGTQQGNPLDQSNGAGSGASPVQTGTVKPSQGNELLITSYVEAMAGSAVPSSPFTVVDTAPYVPGKSMGVTLAYSIQSAAASVNPAWTLAGAGNQAATVATFK